MAILKPFRTYHLSVQHIGALVVVIIIAALGAYLLTSSHAAAPYSSAAAENGALSGSASKQQCSGSTSSDGNCVVFGGSTTANSYMAVGLNAGGWGENGANDVTGAVKYVRLDYANPATYQGCSPTSQACDIGYYSADNAKIDVDFSVDLATDSYDSGGVSAINPNTWASDAVSWYQTYCTPSECPMIEVLNEPSGDWFWGANSADQQNASAYATLVQTTYTAFHNAYGAKAPLILASYDSSTWFSEWWSSSMNNYYDGIVVHPYGGDGTAPAQSAQGNRSLVEDAHSASGKPVYVTEVGWPTDDSGATVTSDNATGDSLQWPRVDSAANGYPGLDQCDNIFNFIAWARSTGYVSAVLIFGFADYGSNDYYGIADSSGNNKPSYTALKDAAANLPNPCPSAANGYTLQSS